MGIFDNLAGVRMNTELRFILESPNRMAGLDILARLGGKLRYLDEEVEYGAPESRLIRRAERLLRRFRLQEAWVVYLALLLSRLSNERVRNVVNRLHLTNDEKYTIEHGLALHDQLASISHGFTEKLKNSQVYFCLHGLKDESFAIAACLALPGSPVRRLIKTYADELRNVAIELAGADLLKLGFSEGPDIGKALQLILAAKLDGLVASREDEIAYVQTLRLAQDA